MLLIKNGDIRPSYLPLILPEAKDLTPDLSAAGLWSEGIPNDGPIRHPIAGASLLSADDQWNDAGHQTGGSMTTEQASADAARLITEAQARVGEIERSAREKAVAEVRATLEAEAEAALEPLRAELSRSIAEAGRLRDEITASVEHEMVQLALEIAKKVVHREVTVDREIVVSLARVSLIRLHGRAAATIHLHPDDYQYVSALREKLGAGNAIELTADPLITRGGCLIETDLGDVDARIEQQFSEIARGFLSDSDV